MHDAIANPDFDGRDALLIESLKGEIGKKSNLKDESIRVVNDVLSQRDEQAVTFEITGGQMAQLFGLLQDQANTLVPQVWFKDVGTVQHIGNGVATLSGLHGVSTDELVVFPNGVTGLVLNLEEERVDVILLGPADGIRGGDLVTSTETLLKIPVGPKMLGRIVDPLGQPIDDGGPIRAAAYSHLEADAPGIVERSPVNEPLQTGTKMIDALIPLGRGQRELIVGDRQTGKTTLAIDTIINQKDSDVDCIYVSVGQKKSSTLAVIEQLQAAGAMEYTTVVMASSDDPPALRYIAPYAGCSMAEHF